MLGFTKKQINSYVTENFGTDEQYQHQFESYHSCYPHICALMYIPLNCSIVVDVYRSSKARDSIVPRTLTELYTVLTRILLSRYLTDHKVHGKKRRWNLQSLADVPSDVKQNLDFRMCKLGEEGMRMLARGSCDCLHHVQEINLNNYSDVKNGVIHLGN